MGLLLTGCGRQKSEMSEESVKPGASETVKDAMQEATKQIDHDVTFGMPVRSFSGLFYVELMKGAQRAVDEMNEKPDATMKSFSWMTTTNSAVSFPTWKIC